MDSTFTEYQWFSIWTCLCVLLAGTFKGFFDSNFPKAVFFFLASTMALHRVTHNTHFWRVLEPVRDFSMWIVNTTSKADRHSVCNMMRSSGGDFLNVCFTCTPARTYRSQPTDSGWQCTCILSTVMQIHFTVWETKAQRGKETCPKTTELECRSVARIERQAPGHMLSAQWDAVYWHLETNRGSFSKTVEPLW